MAKVNKLVLFFVIYTFTFLVFFKTLPYTLPFVLAFLCAFALQRPTNYLIKRFKFKNSLASLTTTVIFFTVIVSMLALIITVFASELVQLGKNIQSYLYQNPINVGRYFDKAQAYYKNLDPTIVRAIENNLSSSITKISTALTQIISATGSGIFNFIATIPYLIMVILFTLLSTYFFNKDLTSAKNIFLKNIPSSRTDKLSHVYHESKKMLGNYLLSYMLIILLTFIETIIGFSILHVKYTVILSVLSAIFDILPILGIGSIYVPVAIIYIISHNYFTGVGILVLYALVSIIRQIVEPKLVSSSLGIHPVPILAALFIGLKANGISGMVFCVFLVVFYTVLKKVNLL